MSVDPTLTPETTTPPQNEGDNHLELLNKANVQLRGIYAGNEISVEDVQVEALKPVISKQLNLGSIDAQINTDTTITNDNKDNEKKARKFGALKKLFDKNLLDPASLRPDTLAYYAMNIREIGDETLNDQIRVEVGSRFERARRIKTAGVDADNIEDAKALTELLGSILAVNNNLVELRELKSGIVEKIQEYELTIDVATSTAGSLEDADDAPTPDIDSTPADALAPDVALDKADAVDTTTTPPDQVTAPPDKTQELIDKRKAIKQYEATIREGLKNDHLTDQDLDALLDDADISDEQKAVIRTIKADREAAGLIQAVDTAQLTETRIDALINQVQAIDNLSEADKIKHADAIAGLIKREFENSRTSLTAEDVSKLIGKLQINPKLRAEILQIVNFRDEVEKVAGNSDGAMDFDTMKANLENSAAFKRLPTTIREAILRKLELELGTMTIKREGGSDVKVKFREEFQAAREEYSAYKTEKALLEAKRQEFYASLRKYQRVAIPMLVIGGGTIVGIAGVSGVASLAQVNLLLAAGGFSAAIYGSKYYLENYGRITDDMRKRELEYRRLIMDRAKVIETMAKERSDDDQTLLNRYQKIIEGLQTIIIDGAYRDLSQDQKEQLLRHLQARFGNMANLASIFSFTDSGIAVPAQAGA